MTADLPPGLRPKMDRLLEDGETVRFAAESDLSSDTSFGERWLVVTDRRIVVFGRDPKAPAPGRDGLSAGVDGYLPEAELALSSVLDAEVESVVGGGRLIVRTAEGRQPLLHFSSSLFDRFGGAAKGLRRLASGRAPAPEASAEPRCAKCGRLLADRQERCPFCIEYREALRRILAYLEPYKWRTAGCVAVTTGAKALALAPPMLMKLLIDRVLPAKDVPGLLWIVGGMLAVNLAQAGLTIWNGNQIAWLASRVGSDIRGHVFRAVVRLRLKFFDRHPTGQVFTRIMNDTGQLQSFLIEGFPYLAEQVVILLGVLTILFWHSPTLTLLVMIPVPAMFLGQYLFWTLVRSLSHKWWNQQAILNNRLNESINGIRVAKAFGQEAEEVRRFETQNERVFEARWKADRFWMLFHPAMNFIVSSGVVIVWYAGGLKVAGGEMTLGTLFAFNYYLWMFYGPLQWFNQVNNWLTKAFAGAERIFETIDSAPEPYEPADAAPLPRARGELEFRDVTFSHEKGTPAVRGASFKVRPGELIGLVGKSGSGKSTLLSLIARFYDPDEGEILVDGVPLKRIRLADLRRNVGLVLQDPFLFSVGVGDNIAYGRPGAGFEEVVEAARAANAHDFVLAKGDAYDTRVGERGNRLSGGEKQRVSIARALLHDPAILLLDEATSSVDSETEAKIQQALGRLVKHRTTIVAAHRLSTLRHADRIFVMEEGRLAEVGTHEELLERKGIYWRLVKAQEELWRKSKDRLTIVDAPPEAPGE